MVRTLRLILVTGFLALAGWAGLRAYGYFFSRTAPELTLIGIEPEGWYTGDAQCTVKGHDAYKVKDISIALDGKPLVPTCKIGRKEFNCPFTIPTKTLTNGKHVLQIAVQNSTYTGARAVQELPFTVDNTPLQAAFIKGEDDGKVFQGRTLHVQFQVNKEIKQAHATVLSKRYDCSPEAPEALIYECFIPTECEANPNEYVLTLEITDKVGNTVPLETKFQIVSYPFKKQTLKLDADKVKVENDTGLPEKQLEAEIEQLTRKSPKQKLWQGMFYTPTEIKEPRQITTEFGVIRTTQERGVRRHKALDIYNTPRSVIWAPQDGIVVLKARYAHSGNTVIIDHGLGILSLLFHLDSFAPLEVGEKIKKGNPVGTLGKTGYATGYHLHWEMRINNIAIDPMQWTKQGF